MNSWIDLHTHSNASDGQYSPHELVRLAQEAGIDVLALCDHDTISGIDEALAAGRRYGVRVIPGVEISAEAPRSMHILGYGFSPESPVMRAFTAQLQVLRRERKELILHYLRQNGVALTAEEVEQFSAGGVVGRPHFARAMLAKGYVATVEEAFERYLGTPAFMQIERPKPSPAQVIGTLRAAGALPVLAHPFTLRQSPQELEQTLVRLASDGLAGLECLYSLHTPDFAALCERLAARLGLLVSGGSDFHGEAVKPAIRLGSGIAGNLCLRAEQVSLLTRLP